MSAFQSAPLAPAARGSRISVRDQASVRGLALAVALVALAPACTRAWDPDTGEPLVDPRTDEAYGFEPDGAERDGVAANTEVRLADNLAEEQPADVFVLPVENRTGLRELDLPDWRELLIDGLIERRYSPLGVAYGDARRAELSDAGDVTPLALAEALEADALLVPRLLVWDESQLESRATIGVEAELVLVDPRLGALEDVLWGYRLERRIELPARSVRNSTREDLRRRVLERLSDQFMERLTQRDPRRLPTSAPAAATEGSVDGGPAEG